MRPYQNGRTTISPEMASALFCQFLLPLRRLLVQCLIFLACNQYEETTLLHGSQCSPGSVEGASSVAAVKMSKSLPAFGVLGLLLAVLVNGLVSVARAQENVEAQESAMVESGEITAFHDALTTIESDQGAYAEGLAEQLYGLGLALQQRDRHKEAITAFKRGVHLTRINQGLYSLEQIPLIQSEISSNLAIGELVETDQRQIYLLKIQQHSLPGGESLVQALMQHASWQQRAYELEIGGTKAGFGRLQSMWDLYSAAINDISDNEDPTSPRLLPPLHGLIKTQYLMSALAAGKKSTNVQDTAPQHRIDGDLRQTYKTGKSVIQSIYELELNHHGQNSLPVAQSLVMLGDWMLWNNKHDAAHRAYLDAMQELIKLDDAVIHMERIFGAPVPLPDIDGIRGLPPAVEPGEGKVLLEFSVNTRGRAFRMTRLDEVESDKKKVQRLMRRIRKTKFRPRYEGEKPAVTEKILRAYDIE